LLRRSPGRTKKPAVVRAFCWWRDVFVATVQVLKEAANGARFPPAASLTLRKAMSPGAT
jgi:hypothetical protein